MLVSRHIFCCTLPYSIKSKPSGPYVSLNRKPAGREIGPINSLHSRSHGARLREPEPGNDPQILQICMGWRESIAQCSLQDCIPLQSSPDTFLHGNMSWGLWVLTVMVTLPCTKGAPGWLHGGAPMLLHRLPAWLSQNHFPACLGLPCCETKPVAFTCLQGDFERWGGCGDSGRS